MKKIFFFLLALAGMSAAALACPMCQEAVSRNNAKLTQGFANSISLLMAAPYLLFGALTFTIVRSARRKKE